MQAEGAGRRIGSAQLNGRVADARPRVGDVDKLKEADPALQFLVPALIEQIGRRLQRLASLTTPVVRPSKGYGVKSRGACASGSRS